jgi:hypothetical protein
MQSPPLAGRQLDVAVADEEYALAARLKKELQVCGEAALASRRREWLAVDGSQDL